MPEVRQCQKKMMGMGKNEMLARTNIFAPKTPKSAPRNTPPYPPVAVRRIGAPTAPMCAIVKHSAHWRTLARIGAK